MQSWSSTWYTKGWCREKANEHALMKLSSIVVRLSCKDEKSCVDATVSCFQQIAVELPVVPRWLIEAIGS